MKREATRESIVLCAAIQTCLDGMGGYRPTDLFDDMYTWFDWEDIVCDSISPHAARGYVGAWERKGWWIPNFDDEGNGAFTDDGVAEADRVWNEVEAWAEERRNGRS